MQFTPLEAASALAEYDVILDALKKTNFSKTKAAALLNINKKTLYNKLKKYQEVIESTGQEIKLETE